MHCSRITTTFLIIGLLTLSGCSDVSIPTPPGPTTDVHKRIAKICRDEFKITPVLLPYQDTLFVYLPMEEPILEVKATEAGPSQTETKQERMTIKFLDSVYKDNSFNIRFDVSKVESYVTDYGYGTPYSQEYLDRQRHLITAVARAFSDVEADPTNDRKMLKRVAGDVDYLHPDKNKKHKTLVHSYVKTEKVPSFIVIVIADIINGIETKVYGYLRDFKRGIVDPDFMEEYMKRIVADNTIGHPNIIGDKDGSHIRLYNLTWGEFLAKQIKHRVNFKYYRSSFPPTEDTVGEILAIVGETTSVYKYNDYSQVDLFDLSQEKRYIFDRKQIESFRKK